LHDSKILAVVVVVVIIQRRRGEEAKLAIRIRTISSPSSTLIVEGCNHTEEPHLETVLPNRPPQR
jgi:hypothetical protein